MCASVWEWGGEDGGEIRGCGVLSASVRGRGVDCEGCVSEWV